MFCHEKPKCIENQIVKTLQEYDPDKFCQSIFYESEIAVSIFTHGIKLLINEPHQLKELKSLYDENAF